MKQNAQRGFLNGGNTPYGYRRIPVQDGNAQRAKLAINEVEAPIVQRIFQLCVQGMGAK